MIFIKNCIIKKKLVNKTRNIPKYLGVFEVFNFRKMQMLGVRIVSLWLSGMSQLSKHFDYSFRNIALLAKGGQK